MTALATPTTGTGLAEAVRAKLQAATGPLKLAEVVTGLPKPKGMKPAQLKDQVRELLEEEVRLGEAFARPSGKKGEVRYWSRDERQHLRDRAIESAATPQPMSAFKKTLGQEVKGVDGDYLVTLVKELINDELLYEYPAKTKAGGPLFGATRLRPLDLHKKAVGKLVAECNKLLTNAGVTVEDLLRALRDGLGNEKPQPATATAQVGEATARRDEPIQPPSPPREETGSLEDLILKAVAESPVVSLASLRSEMPREYQGDAFDAAVLRLADDEKITVSKDADPSRFSEQEAAMYVREGSHLYTTIMARS
jgi:hypothetical protein